MLTLDECATIAERQLEHGRAKDYFEFEDSYYIRLEISHRPQPVGVIYIYKVDRKTGICTKLHSLWEMKKTPGLMEASKGMKPIRKGILSLLDLNKKGLQAE